MTVVRGTVVLVTHRPQILAHVDNLLVSQPDAGEQALDIAEMLVASNSVDVIVVDSVAALTPRAEIEGEMGDSHVGLQARLMSQADLLIVFGASFAVHTGRSVISLTPDFVNPVRRARVE